MSTIKVSAIQDLSGGQDVNVPNAAKVWVSFIGSGTVTIREDYNITSITDNGAGDYTLNFTNAFADAKYATQISSWYGSDTLTPLVPACGLKRGQAPTTSTVRVQIASAVWSNSNAADVDGIYVTIHR